MPGPLLLTHVDSFSRLLKENCYWYLSLFANAVGVILLCKGNELTVSVAREAERYVPHQLAVLDQSDSCCLEQ